MPTVKTARQVRHHALAAAETGLDQRRQQRQGHEADQPEPRDDVRAAPQAPIQSELAQQSRPWTSRDCAVMTRPGAAGPATGMRWANAQEATASAMITPTTSSALLASATAMPPAMVPMRIARKVAPSTSALPAASSAVSSFSGRMPYFSGPNSAAMTPKRPSADEQDWHRVPEEADRRQAGDRDLGEPDPAGDARLVEAVGQLPAERGQDEERGDEYDARGRDQRAGIARPRQHPRRRVRTGSAWPAHS